MMKRVYVLYTGGTIGCTGRPLAPMPGENFAALVASMPGLAGGRVAGYEGLTYTIDWMERALDSSDMTPADWLTIARSLLTEYLAYDGFVVLHGTDTMSFTASALSFLLPGLSKPVILTGSQLPLASSLNDALPNLVGALVLAGTTSVPECCLYFNSLLLRGNRSVKVDANQFAAFDSPNFPPLARVGAEISLSTRLILPVPDRSSSLERRENVVAAADDIDRLAARVGSFSVLGLVLYPGIRASTIQSMLQGTEPPVRGVVIEAFGAGNGPASPDFSRVLSEANDRGVVLVDNTQVLTGKVQSRAYVSGSVLADAGTISALDMTPEASLTKLVYLLGFEGGADQVKRDMQRDLRGELTPVSEPDPGAPRGR